MSKKNTARRGAGKPTIDPASDSVQLPKHHPWRLPVALGLVTIGALGLWWYLRWSSAQLLRESETEISSVEPPAALPSPAATAAAPSWARPCAEAVCAVSQTGLAETWDKIDDAAKDGWDTEVFSASVMKQYDKLKKAVTHGPVQTAEVSFLVDSQTRVGRLLPTNLNTTFQDSSLMVQRLEATDPAEPVGEPDDAQWRTGPDGWAQSLTELLASYTNPEQIRWKLKVFRVTGQGDSVETQQTLEIFGPTATGVKEINSIWVAHWKNDVEHPILLDVRVKEFETAERKGRTLFSDCTESALVANTCFEQQLMKGFNHWLDRSQFQRYFDLLGAPGIAVGDLNEDGIEDLYVCQEGGLPNLLFLQRPDGTLEDFSEQSGANWLEHSRAALIVDINNDGHNDLLVAVEGGVVVAEGKGTGEFTVRRVIDTADDVLSLSVADYDLDGKLDVYVGVYYGNEYSSETQEQAILTPDFVYYDSKNGGPNSLIRNECTQTEWNFRDVTNEVGMSQDNKRLTLAAAWEDLDNDGDQDLYVANDFGPNNLFRNDLQPDGSRTFVDIAWDAGAEDSASGMAVTVSDYDHDGWMDIYVSNMFSYAGNRIMFQEQFKSDADDKIKKVFQRFARGNTLLRNLGKADGDSTIKFEDRSVEAAVNRGRWAWGSAFFDINNDGWDDLLVANGYVTTEDTGDL